MEIKPGNEEFPLSFSILFICLKHFETAWQSQGYWSEASSAQIDAAAPSDLTGENSSIAGSLSLCELENGLKWCPKLWTLCGFLHGKLLRYHHFHCGFLWGSELYTIYGLLSWSHDFRRWLWMLWMLWVKALVVHHQNSRYHLVPSGTSRSACSSPDDFQTMKWNVSFTCWPVLLWSFLVSHHPTMVISCFTLKLGWTQ